MSPAEKNSPQFSPQTVAQTLERILDKHGFNVLAGIWMLYWVTWVLGGTLFAISSNLKAHMYDTYYVALQICRNTAKDDTQARSCAPPAGLKVVD